MTIDTKAKKPLRTTREFGGASTGKPNEQKSKAALARDAKQRGENTFEAFCRGCDAVSQHYASNAKCVACRAEMGGKRWERTSKDAGALARHNERQRAAMAKLREGPHQRAKDINSRTVQRLRNMTMPGPQGAIPVPRPESAMPSKATLRECAEAVMRAPAAAQMDHAVPLMGVHPVTGEWVVSGLHVPYNLEPMEARANKRKSNYFDPENPLEFQKPRNSFPGGQFHGEIGEIERMRYTVPTTLELWTKDEFRAAAVEAGNTAMEGLAA